MKKYIILLVSIMFLTSCGSNLSIQETNIELKEGEELFTLEAWADNWFTAYVGDELIIEDSVSINTERSFNAEKTRFAGSYPLHLNVIMKDFKENDTGLEYIGTKKQQMGDGGFIMQVTDSSGDTIITTNNLWRCKVIHDAPVDKSCESSDNPQEGVGVCASNSESEPENWKSVDFDDSSWNDTTVHSASAVGPKDGYDEIDWNPSAEIIWGPDLETNNTVLCRVTIESTVTY